ncbi:MAG: hypothetical protein K6E50_15185, partial [Lachnospiraceae bacterium]|nr:hypothetical protein [Lachnospiraceae bacterium]
MDTKMLIYKGEDGELYRNDRYNSIEMHFYKKPGYDVLDSIKILGWKWQNNSGCWYNRNNEENLTLAKKLLGESVDDNKRVREIKTSEVNSYVVDSNRRLVRLGSKDFLVRRNMNYCLITGHNVQDVDAILEVVDRVGTKRLIRIPVTWCETCHSYYIFEQDYLDLREYGIPVCCVCKDS